MPSLADHPSDEFVKLLLIGDSKAGKTSALISLVEAGYKLYILDMDNLLDPLAMLVRKQCPEKLENVRYRSLRDKYKAGPLGAQIDGTAMAYVNTTKMIQRWKYKEGDEEIDEGEPYKWGSDCILVLDSLSRLCDAAYDWQEQMTPSGKSGEKDGRAVYGNAQDAVEKLLALLTAANFRTNVIVIAHILYQEQPDKTVKGFPQGVGQKLSPKIPQYFPAYALAEKKGEKRVLRTLSTQLIDLANPKPFDMGKDYPLETGLRSYFEVIRGPLEKAK